VEIAFHCVGVAACVEKGTHSAEVPINRCLVKTLSALFYVVNLAPALLEFFFEGTSVKQL